MSSNINQSENTNSVGLFHRFRDEIKTAVLIRRIEQRLLELYEKGKVNGTIHTCVGQEFSGVFVSKHVSKQDIVFSNHRGHGHYIAHTGDVNGLLAEIMGKTTGCSGGIGGSQHFCNTNYFSNGIQGGMTPVAAGMALARKIQNKDAIVISYIGDGTLGEGILYETLNICSLWDIPIIFILENNQYAQSTNHKQTFKGEIKKRVEGFDIKYYCSNTWELLNLDSTVKKAVNFVRTQGKPVFLEISTYRLNSHSKSDDNRDQKIVETFRKADLINILFQECQEEMNALLLDVNLIIEKAEEFAYLSETLSNYPNEKTYNDDIVGFKLIPDFETQRVNERIYNVFQHCMNEKDNIILLGEDIENNNEYNPNPYGGAFKVTRNLSNIFTGRIKNTPISEAAITGIGSGLAIGGMIPVVEIMFGDFSTLIFDQLLQHACKFHKMYNGKLNVQLIVRTPMGGKRGYGPTHSQSIEKYFLGFPDLDIIVLNCRLDPFTIYKSIFDNIKHPYLVIENKVLYTRAIPLPAIPGFNILQSSDLFPTVKISPVDADAEITILCYGGMLEEVETAIINVFESNEVFCEVVCPVQIQPVNIRPIIESVRMTGKLLIVEEGTSIAAFGAEIIALLCENNVTINKVIRLANNTIIPCSYEAEMNLIPNSFTISKAILSLLEIF